MEMREVGVYRIHNAWLPNALISSRKSLVLLRHIS
jgi:hypothetical protein